jgi:alkylation response protein AidB-like acyl-CoA dehydrogenase
VICDIIHRFGTDEQKSDFLPGLASGSRRGGLALTEADAGTDVKRLQTTATRHGDGYLINGSKMWITNGKRGDTFVLAAKTQPHADPPHKGISAFIIEKGRPGFRVVREIDTLGYRGVENCELAFENFFVPAKNLIGGVEGEGFKQIMTGLESERINVAARGVGVARAAFEDALAYSQKRETFGKPICEHQTIQIKLAEMATRIEASRLLVYSAAEKKDRGERCDLEAAMAKLFATETAQAVALESLRIHGGAGYSTDLPVERYYRDAPLLMIGGGTNELQHLIIARRLLAQYPIQVPEEIL